MTACPVILWFRRDLRLLDNPALEAVAKHGAPVIPLYIFEETEDHPLGGASRWWLHHSLHSLQLSLRKINSDLVLRKGKATSLISKIVDETNASAIFWNRRYYKPEIEQDKIIKENLQDRGLYVHTFNGSLLNEPWEIKTGSGSYYKVFTPYWKSVREKGPTRTKIVKRPTLLTQPSKKIDSDNLEIWGLLPKKPDWAKQFSLHWSPGERGAQKNLTTFLQSPINSYDEDRNRPHIEGTSRLSPHLAFGEISPLQIWIQVHHEKEKGTINESQSEKFLSEIVWREFSHVLLYFFPDLPHEPMKPAFSYFPWQENPEALEAWQQGKTGYPIVDAGMRELWQTGWMHNRVRMIVASFLIKHLLIPWQEGEAWFWDTLLDADIANNSAGWQWVAGCGADASPYFRIFNPFGQGEKFDPEGIYVKKYVPELKKLPKKYIHQPWTAPKEILAAADLTLGENYPEPIVDHKIARTNALDGYALIKGK